jgi:uncharacterized damage-inducible protein DinB
MNVADSKATLAPFYKGWDTYNDYLVDITGKLSQEQLLLSTSANQRPAWALAVHIAGTRVHWLTRMFGEEHSASRYLLDWDEDGEMIFTGPQIAEGMQRSWDLVADVLNRWTVDTMDRTITTPRGHARSRQWVIWHLIEHDLHHGGELFYTLGMHGIDVPDW